MLIAERNLVDSLRKLVLNVSKIFITFEKI